MPTSDRVLRALGLRLRQLREARGLTQEQLGEKSDLDQTYLSGIERGTRNPSVVVLSRVAKALKLTLSELMEGV